MALMRLSFWLSTALRVRFESVYAKRVVPI